MNTRSVLKELIDEIPEENLMVTEDLLRHVVKDLSPDNKSVCSILPKLLTLQYDKEKLYGSSWKKYGHIGTFMNLTRKTDRVENIMRKAMEQGVNEILRDSAGSATETFVDTIADIANYSLLWLSLLRDTAPEQYNRFLELNNLVDTKDITEK